MLTDRLRGADQLTCAGAATALGALDPFAAEAVPALIETARDPNPEVTHKVLLTLGKIGDSRAAPVEAQTLHPEVDSTRYAATTALFTLEPKAAPAISNLVDTVNHEVCPGGGLPPCRRARSGRTPERSSRR